VKKTNKRDYFQFQEDKGEEEEEEAKANLLSL